MRPYAMICSKVGCGAHTDCGFLTLLAQEEGAAPVQVA